MDPRRTLNPSLRGDQMKLKGSIALSMLSLAACGDAGEGAGKKFEVSVAPLDLATISEACYHLTVYNTGLTGTHDATTTVWDLDDVCAGQYGDESGSITYIGTCDADGNAGDEDGDATTRYNTVRLILNELWDENIGLLSDPDDYANPCPSDDPCFIEEVCEENADTLIEFNLTVLRSAKQGFFDVAVNFKDVFCSMKFDCDAGNLLFDANGERARTTVLGFACTAGVAGVIENKSTFMYMDNIKVACDNPADEFPATQWTLTTGPDGDGDPDPEWQGLGNQMFPPGPSTGQFYPNSTLLAPPVFQWAVYADKEFDNDETIEKNFWNVAIGWNMDAMDDCNVTVEAGVWDSMLGDDNNNDDDGDDGAFEDNVTPYFRWNIPVSRAGEGAWQLTQCDGPQGDNNVQPGELSADFGNGDFYGLGVLYTKPQVNDLPEFDNCGSQVNGEFELMDSCAPDPT